MTVPDVAKADGPDLDALAEAFEARRLEAQAASRARTVPAVAVGAGAAALIGGALASYGAPWPSLLLCVVPAGLAWRWWGKPRTRYMHAVKDEAFPAAIRQLGPDWRFDRRGGLDLGAVKASRLLPGYDDARQQDLIKGSWHGIGVEMAEAKLTEQRGSGKSRRTVTTFNGLIVRLHLPDVLEGEIIVRRRFATAPLFSGLERVRLETSRFEKEFNVYAEDQVAARVVLTVTVMERLAALSDDLMRLGGGRQAQRLEASFRGSVLTVLIPCNADLFEPADMGTPGHVRQDMTRLQTEIRDVLRIAEALSLRA